MRIGTSLRSGLAALACLIAAPAPAAWIEARTSHFTVYSDDDPARVRALATRLERFDKAIRQLRGLPEQPSDRANPVIVYVVANVAAVQKLCAGGRKSSACTNVYGFYNGRAEGSVAFMPRHAGSGGKLDLNAQIVLFHEYSHHIMLANYGGAYPAWVVEGYAEFNSTASFDKDGTVGFGRPAAHRFYGLILGPNLPIETLLTANGARLKPDQQEALYGRGWLLTHYLTFEPKRKGQFEAYLTGLGTGKSSLDAAKAAFGDLATLDRDLKAYMKRPGMSFYEMTVPKIADNAISVRPLTAGEAAMMPVRLRSDRGVDAKAAALVVVDARKLAAPFPADPGAQTALAEAEYEAGHDDQAEAAADRALALSAGDRTAMMYKGRARVHRLHHAGSHDAAAWREARSWFVKANRAEPDDAAPLSLFYGSFIAEGVKPTANAVTGLARAFDLAPQDDDLRFMLARQYLLDARWKDARGLLAPLAFNPHADPDNPAAALVGLIDAGDTKAIAARLREPIEEPDEQ